MIGARAYLTLDAQPRYLAAAIARVTAGRLHIEPGTASALRYLVDLTGHSQAQPEIALALRLASRGWAWPEVLMQLDLRPAAVSELLLRVLEGKVPDNASQHQNDSGSAGYALYLTCAGRCDTASESGWSGVMPSYCRRTRRMITVATFKA